MNNERLLRLDSLEDGNTVINKSGSTILVQSPNFEALKWDQDGLTGPANTSGIDPLDHRVLVIQDEVQATFAQAPSILRPVEDERKEKYAMTKATVVAVGTLAWAEAKHDARNFGLDFHAPQPGDRVQIGKYTGNRITGADGREYTIINDEDVIGRLIEEEAYGNAA